MFSCGVDLLLKGFISIEPLTSVTFAASWTCLKANLGQPPWPDTDSETTATRCVWCRLHFLCVTAAAEALTVV